MKKEDIYVKLTKKNIDKVISILEERGYKPNFPNSERLLKNGDNEELYLSYNPISNYCDWVVSLYEPNKTRIKPKQLKELLENESTCTYKYLGNLIYEDTSLWEGVKGNMDDKGEKYIPENKTLEVGKWYKHPNYSDGRFLFMFKGEFGYAKAIGFDASGRYCNDLTIYEDDITYYNEVKPEEVIEAFIYHMENFANKRKNITTADLRDILNLFHREEISFGKVVELVNKGGK